MNSLDRFHIYWDGDQDLNGEDVGATLFELLEISRILEHEVSGPFLGLGAGWGVAEIEFAKRLNLLEVILVDKAPPILKNFTGEYIQSDIFAFLENSARKFGFITVIGCEYFIGGVYWKKLLTLLASVCLSGAIVVINLTPFHENNLPVGKNFNTVMSRARLLVLQKT